MGRPSTPHPLVLEMQSAHTLWFVYLLPLISVPCVFCLGDVSGKHKKRRRSSQNLQQFHPDSTTQSWEETDILSTFQAASCFTIRAVHFTVV